VYICAFNADDRPEIDFGLVKEADGDNPICYLSALMTTCQEEESQGILPPNVHLASILFIYCMITKYSSLLYLSRHIRHGVMKRHYCSDCKEKTKETKLQDDKTLANERDE
jgi:hypothetical protein